MNDTSAGWSPESDDDEEGERRLRSTVERALMDRARAAAERDRQKEPRRLGPSLVALSAALVLVLVIGLGFDAFLTSVQRVLRMISEEEQRQQQETPAPDPTEPMPAYIVPEDDAPPPP